MNNDDLIKALIGSTESLVTVTKQTNENVKDLTDSVNELIVDRAVRVETDVAQHKVNDRLMRFMDDNSDNLHRLNRFYLTYDKAIVPVVVVIFFALAALLGFDWKK